MPRWRKRGTRSPEPVIRPIAHEDLEDCVERLRCIVEAERQSWRAAGAAARAIAASFGEPDSGAAPWR